MRLPDGRLQLITMPNPSSAGTSSPATPVVATTLSTPQQVQQQQQTMVRPTIALRPQQTTTLMLSSPTAGAAAAAPQTRLIMPTGLGTGGLACMASAITIPARAATSILGVTGAITTPSSSKPLIIGTTGRLPGTTVLSAPTGTPGVATQQLVSLASGQQMLTTPLLAGQSAVMASPQQVSSPSPALGGLPVMSIQAPGTAGSTTPTMVALQSSQGTSLLSGQSLLARPLTTSAGGTATSLLSMALPSAGGTLTLGGQKVAQIIQNSAAPATSGVNTTVVMATPAGIRTLSGGTAQLQLKTVSASSVAGGKTTMSPLRQIITPIQVKKDLLD